MLLKLECTQVNSKQRLRKITVKVFLKIKLNSPDEEESFFINK